MILEFETGLVKHCHKFDDRIRKIEFTDTFDTSYNLWKVAEYPICEISRQLAEDMLWPKSFDYEDDKMAEKLFVAKINYRVRLWYEKEAYAITQLQRFRFYQERNPYIIFPFDGCEMRIGMRFEKIGLNVYKNGDNRQGAQRAVESIFESSIPFQESEDFALIESVQININKELEIKVIK